MLGSRRLLEAGARYVIFQMAEVAVPRELFQKTSVGTGMFGCVITWEECVGMKNGQIGGSDVLPAVFRALLHSLHMILCCLCLAQSIRRKA